MKFSVQQIKATSHEGPISFEETIDVSELVDLKNNDIRQIDPVRVEGICTVEKNEVVFSFTMKGKMILPCARTLVDVSYPFQFRATEIFTTVLSKADEEEEIHFIADDVIDLRPFILEAIVLQMPYRVFSDEKMIEEGEGWSFFTEDEMAKKDAERIDPRLAKLQKLLDDNKDSN